MIYAVLIWFVIALIFFVAELSSPGLFYFFSCVSGAVCALIAAYGDFSCVVQLFLFISSSCITFMALRHWVHVSQHHTQRTTASSLVGRRVVVTAALPEHGSGYVKVYGDEWMAREREGRAVAQGMLVEIVAVRGSHVVVTIIA